MREQKLINFSFFFYFWYETKSQPSCQFYYKIQTTNIILVLFNAICPISVKPQYRCKHVAHVIPSSLLPVTAQNEN